jgi:hypothetical protein
MRTQPLFNTPWDGCEGLLRWLGPCYLLPVPSDLHLFDNRHVVVAWADDRQGFGIKLATDFEAGDLAMDIREVGGRRAWETNHMFRRDPLLCKALLMAHRRARARGMLRA